MQVQGRPVDLRVVGELDLALAELGVVAAHLQQPADEVLDAHFGDRVFLALHGQHARRQQRDGADERLAEARRMRRHLAVVGPFDVDHFLPLEVGGLEEVHVDAKRLVADLDEHPLLFAHRPADLFALDEHGGVVLKLLHLLAAPVGPSAGRASAGARRDAARSEMGDVPAGGRASARRRGRAAAPASGAGLAADRCSAAGADTPALLLRRPIARAARLQGNLGGRAGHQDAEISRNATHPCRVKLIGINPPKR